MISEYIKTTLGWLRGRELKHEREPVFVFKGVRYAQPPCAGLRFRAPRPIKPWPEIREAMDFGPVCPQVALPIAEFARLEQEQAEDCLTLNIWTAARERDESRPVMVWLHGGAHIYGSGSDPKFNGERLARMGVVVVTINYRLGPLGFLAHSSLSSEGLLECGQAVSGNYGLLDQLEALRWTRENVQAFGGDPGNVTLFGVSSGALCISMLMASDLGSGLFHKAIAQSGSSFLNSFPLRNGLCPSNQKFPSAEAMGSSFVATLEQQGLNPSNLPAADLLRAVSASELVECWATCPEYTEYYSLPVIDDFILKDTAPTVMESRCLNSVPLLLGTNENEGSLIFPSVVPEAAMESRMGLVAYLHGRLGHLADRAIALYAVADRSPETVLEEMVGDEMYTWPVSAWALASSRSGQPTFVYRFRHTPSSMAGTSAGAYHSAETPYVFGTSLDALDDCSTEIIRSEEFVTTMMMDTWVRFARTGDPGGGVLPEWPPYRETERWHMVLAERPVLENKLRTEQMSFWEEYYRSGGKPLCGERRPGNRR